MNVEAFYCIHAPRVLDIVDSTSRMSRIKSTVPTGGSDVPAAGLHQRIWSSTDSTDSSHDADSPIIAARTDTATTGNTAISTATASAGSTTDRTWSVTDDWTQLSQCDNINYNYGSTDNDTGEILILNSIDQVTLAALRMQNFGMSSSSSSLMELSEEDIWVQNSIQQIMLDTDTETNVDLVTDVLMKESVNQNMGSTIDITAGTLNTDSFLDDMGKEIAMLVRCNENSNSNSNSNHKGPGLLFMDECELLDDSEFTASTTTDKQGKSSYERVELHNGVPIWMKDGEFGTYLIESKYST
jgi:hypothetical protein